MTKGNPFVEGSKQRLWKNKTPYRARLLTSASSSHIHRSLTHGSHARRHRETVLVPKCTEVTWPTQIPNPWVLCPGTTGYSANTNESTFGCFAHTTNLDKKWPKAMMIKWEKKFQWPHPRHWLSQPTKRRGLLCCAHRTDRTAENESLD